VTWLSVASLLIGFALLVYLVGALIKAERF
jgi:K+-transporting ATPase KdpF subunit